MIKLTETAAEEVKRIMAKEEIDYHLRVGVQGGGCAGLSYTLGFDKDKNDNDLEENQHGINIICDNKSSIYLDETILDFSPELINGGFKFSNKNAKSSCGCGSSFS